MKTIELTDEEINLLHWILTDKIESYSNTTNYAFADFVTRQSKKNYNLCKSILEKL